MEIIRRGNDINGEDIPEWVLVEVLLRLSSPKIVCSFKLVSKQWLSIISDPIFVRTYISRASPRWTIVSDIMHHKGNDQKGCIIEGVSNGLVLYCSADLHSREVLSSRFIHSYYICNPITRSCIALPVCTNQSFNNGVGFLTRVEDGVLTNFTVVRLGIVRDTNLVCFEVFYSEIGEWKNYAVICLDDSFRLLSNHVVAVNGVLHWISSKGCIIAYDPYQSPRHVRIVKLPLSDHQINPVACLCGEYEGKLRYFTSYSTLIYGKWSSNFEVWVLNDDQIWSLQYTVTEYSFMGSYLAPLCFDPFESDVVCLGSKDGVISYNIKTKRTQVYQKWKAPQLRPSWHYAFLLVIPSWPISLSRFSSYFNTICIA